MIRKWEKLIQEGHKLSKQGNYSKAAEFYEEAAKLSGTFGLVSYYAVSMSNMALMYQLMGDYSRAESLFCQTLEIQKKTRKGRKEPTYARNLSNLADLYKEMKQYDKAESLYQQTLWLTKKKLLRKENPDYALYLDKLARLYQDIGKYTEAEPLYCQALNIRERLVGKEHPDYATSLSNLSSLYQDMKEYAKAEPLCLQALEIRGRLLGQQHPDYAKSFYNMIHLYEQMGRPDKALPITYKALINSLQANDPETVIEILEKTPLPFKNKEQQPEVATILYQIGQQIIDDAQNKFETEKRSESLDTDSEFSRGISFLQKAAELGSQKAQKDMATIFNWVGVRMVNNIQRKLGLEEKISNPNTVNELSQGLSFLQKAIELGSTEAQKNYECAVSTLLGMISLVLEEAGFLKNFGLTPQVLNLIEQARKVERLGKLNETIGFYERALDKASDQEEVFVKTLFAGCLNSRAVQNLNTAIERLNSVNEKHQQQMKNDIEGFLKDGPFWSSMFRSQKNTRTSSENCIKCKKNVSYKVELSEYGEIYLCEEHFSEFNSILERTPQYDFMSETLHLAEEDLNKALKLNPEFEQARKNLEYVRSLKPQFPIYISSIIADNE